MNRAKMSLIKNKCFHCEHGTLDFCYMFRESLFSMSKDDIALCHAHEYEKKYKKIYIQLETYKKLKQRAKATYKHGDVDTYVNKFLREAMSEQYRALIESTM